MSGSDDDFWKTVAGAAGLGGLAYLLATKKCHRCGKRNHNENDRCSNCGAYL